MMYIIIYFLNENIITAHVILKIYIDTYYKNCQFQSLLSPI